MDLQKDQTAYQTVESALQKLQQYVEGENFKGYDPYDTLTSPFKFKSFGNIIPVLAIQFQKRNPVNIRALLGVRKAYNPKALGLFLYSYSKLQLAEPQKDYSKQITFLFDQLKTNNSKGFSGYCWGYNFDWASSGKYIKAYSPNIVVTAFIAKGLFQYYQLSKNPEAATMLESICDFILKDLPRRDYPEGVCFSYTTLAMDHCYNASLLAAVVLAHVYAITGKEDYKHQALKAVDYVIHKQHPDGHWNYSIDEQGKERSQIDFHQGYVIDCIQDVILYCQVNQDLYLAALTKGTAYYRNEQFFENGQAKWRLPKIYPVEIHNQSQGIITFAKMQSLHPEYLTFSQTIAQWTIENMQDKNGFFYYRKLKTYTNKISFMRWSQAWMFVALTDLKLTLKNTPTS